METVMLVTAVAGTLVKAVGQFQAGIAANSQAKLEAKQMEIAAGQERAASQRAAFEERRQSRIVLSNAQAAAAASGAGTTDPSVLNITSSLAGEGEYRALTRMYEGEQSARNYETSAGFRRYEGKQAARAGRIGAMTTLLEGGSSLYQRYGGGGGSQAASGMGSSPMRSTTRLSGGGSIRWNT
jgi:hypothetical protein